MSLEQQVEKLRFQLQQVGEALDHHKHPIASLVISKDWGEAELDIAHDIFEQYSEMMEAGQQPSWGQFEREFDARLGLNYQGIKPVVLAFYRRGTWLDVCYAYADANMVSEFHSMQADIAAWKSRRST